MHSYHVYIIASHTRTLYIGVTSNLEQRIIQHKKKLVDDNSDRILEAWNEHFEH